MIAQSAFLNFIKYQQLTSQKKELIQAKVMHQLYEGQMF